MGVYLVTGAAGFIGSKVSELLLAEGHRVVGVDTVNDAYDPRLKEWRLEQLMPEETFAFHRADICDRAAMEDLFAEDDFDGVVNLAARAGVRKSVEDPWAYQATNATGTLTLLECCRTYEVPKFVLASTSSLYGEGHEVPYHEDLSTAQPLSPYAASKKGAEAMSYTYHYLYGLDVTVFRYFTVYGPAGRPDMSLFRFTQWIREGRPVLIYGDGQQSRDFTYVDDIARGTVLGLKPLGYEIINLGSDTPIVLMDTVRMVEEAVGKPAQLEYQARHKADVLATWADISKARRLLGWSPEWTFERGVQALADWYAEHRTWAKDIRTR
jgi:nucleoside-diphosphate-sugar epimerase